MILHVVGTRPNYIKAAPVIRAIEESGLDQLVVHTSQHYSDNMSKNVMESVGMREPDIVIPKCEEDGIEKFCFILKNLYNIISTHKPSQVVVYGDVDSTLAAALAAKKNNTRLIHVESGLRSFDGKMPEEINRRIVDEISDLCLITEKSGLENLHHKTDCTKVLVGNTMIDSLVWVKNRGIIGQDYENSQINNSIWGGDTDFAILTCHRPSNVDNKDSLRDLMEMCNKIEIPILCPVHPRTKKMIGKFNLSEEFKSIKHLHMVDPINYTDFLRAVSRCSVVITDSGGVQEETTFLKTPCLTIRENTERPSTIDSGSNILVKMHEVPRLIEKIITEPTKDYKIPVGWDGHAAERIVKVVHNDHIC
jgi:UDP-N-acetylglucosamine 2-epimerase (non-hydrolysing)